MNVIPLKPVSVNALIKHTKATWDRADEKRADADEWYTRTGKLLAELKEKVGHGQWLPTLKKLGRSDRRARELMELANEAKTPEQQRDRKRKSMVRTRANRRHVAPISEVDENEEFFGDCSEERWHNSLANICGEIIARPAYWDKELPGWEQFDCPSHIAKLVKEAATVLASIAANVTKRDRKAS